jgi:hypothetical protein
VEEEVQRQVAPSWNRASLVALAWFAILILAGGGSIRLFPHHHHVFGSVLVGFAWALVLWAARATLLIGQYRRPIVFVYPVLLLALIPMSYLLLTNLARGGIALLTMIVTLGVLRRLSLPTLC